jgi:hypothetical protein
MTAGVNPTGFETKTAEQIRSEIEADQRGSTALGADLDTSSNSVVGALNQAVINQLAPVWQLVQACYAISPRDNSKARLDDICELTGTRREAAIRGRVVLQVQLNAGVTLPMGSTAHVLNQPDNRWRTTVAVTNSGGSPATLNVQAESTNIGAGWTANAGTISVIATPVAGWTFVSNSADATEGTNIESDAALRVRREEELSTPGTSPIEAIRADLLRVRDASNATVLASCLVEENESDFTDALGRTPKCVECVIEFKSGLSGDALEDARQRIADQLWNSHAGGINTFGAVSRTVLDSNNESRVQRWTEPTFVDVWVTFTIQLQSPATAYPGDAAFKTAIVEWSKVLRMGDDVVRAQLNCAGLDVPGVYDVLDLTIGVASTGQRRENLPIGPRQKARFDTSRITVLR